MKIVFNYNYPPREKGVTFEPKGDAEIKVAQFYLDNGIARLCDCSKDPKDCGCNNHKSKVIVEGKEEKEIKTIKK